MKILLLKGKTMVKALTIASKFNIEAIHKTRKNHIVNLIYHLKKPQDYFFFITKRALKWRKMLLIKTCFYSFDLRGELYGSNKN